MILGIAVLFAYLFLVALYESWNIPVPVLLSVTVGLVGAMASLWIAGLSNDIYRPDRHRRADQRSPARTPS